MYEFEVYFVCLVSDILIAFGKGQWLVRRKKSLCILKKLFTI